MKVHIFVFEDYGIATLRGGKNEEETQRVVALLTEQSVAQYTLIIEPENEETSTTK